MQYFMSDLDQNLDLVIWKKSWQAISMSFFRFHGIYTASMKFFEEFAQKS